MDRLVQVVAAIVLAASVFMYVQRNKSVSPEVERFRQVGVSREDARTIANYVRVYGDMVLEDGARDEPYINSLRELKDKLRDMGNLVIGTGWKLGDKYPSIPPMLAEWISVDNFDRQQFHTQADSLAAVLEQV